VPAIVTFDGAASLITEIDVGGDNVLDVTEIYSEWKEWVALSDNAKFRSAFSSVGGDPVSPTQSLGTTFFLTNGWRIRPAESNHSLELVGNLFVEGGLGDPFVSTSGAFNVRTRITVSNLIDQVGSTDPAVIANAVRAELAPELAFLDAAVSSRAAAIVADLTRKMLTNRYEVEFGAQRLVLYDDDGLTPIVTQPLETDGGEPVVTSEGVQTKRKVPGFP